MKKESLRVSYGQTLVRLGEDNRDIVVLDADLCKSSMGSMFEAEYPERFFEMGIAEANMVAVATGLSLTGRVPFANSFAAFVPGRCYDQIRTCICNPNLNVKLCGSSAGLSDFGDGSTHQTIDDISLMRILPNMQVFSPADSIQVAKIVEYMVNNKGPMYIRINRNDLPVLTGDDWEFVPGKLYNVREGKDVTVFASGVTLSLSLEAAEELEKEGVSVRVINVPSIKPINRDEAIKACEGVRGIVTAEEHSIYGGLGDAIQAAISPDIAVRHYRFGMMDVFGTSAQNYEELLNYYNFTAASIIKAVKELL